MFGVRLAQKEELVLAIKECNRVTSSDIMDLSDIFSVSPCVRGLPAPQNTSLKFLCQT